MIRAQFWMGWAAGVATLSASAVSAVPPPPQAQELAITLPANQCRQPLSGTVRAYAQPVHGLVVDGPTVLRVLADDPDPALLIDVTHNDDEADLRPVVTGAGLAGTDLSIALPAAGRYRLRVLITGDAARRGRSIAYRLSLSRAMESGAPECPSPP
ncbi:hypothetical protein [Sandarakinorhabdus rubra]|uniref:hypothetical protein n=1 Tax=Sandarakinorhabdus rubra TaxID=2672568 RepID=UPI0013DA08BD|nr:hypothetical protein [Sandarakinorhabdus rubra]